MRMIDRSGVGCPMCMRIPVPNDDDMQWMRSGQPIISLIAEAYEAQKAKARAEAEGTAPAAPAEENKDAVESMNSTMDDLERLFGFGDEPEPEPEPAEEEDDFAPLIEEDTKCDPLMYHYKDSNYLMTGHRDHAIQFCPFCGSKLSETSKTA